MCPNKSLQITFNCVLEYMKTREKRYHHYYARFAHCRSVGIELVGFLQSLPNQWYLLNPSRQVTRLARGKTHELRLYVLASSEP